MSEQEAAKPQRYPIIERNGALYTSSGLPIYVFEPLLALALAGKPDVPWGGNWPEYLSAWVLEYIPLAQTTSYDPDIQRDLSFQSRAGSSRDYNQAVYRGWPLYVNLRDFQDPGVDASRAPRAVSPGIFDLASVNITPLSVPPTTQVEEGSGAPGESGLPTWPDGFSGP